MTEEQQSFHAAFEAFIKGMDAEAEPMDVLIPAMQGLQILHKNPKFQAAPETWAMLEENTGCAYVTLNAILTVGIAAVSGE